MARAPIALEGRAQDNLQFIRTTMERAAGFTAVPGRGGAAMGLVACAAAVIAATRTSHQAWLATWLAAAAVAFPIGVASIAYKARRAGTPVSSAAGRSFVRGLAPPLAAGALLTAALVRADAYDVLPGLWLLLYGAGVVAAGAFSVRVVPILGTVHLLLGALALIAPAGWRDVFLGLGFGVVHVGFGLWIARHHGG